VSDDRRTLLRNTILWIFAALWVVSSYLLADPAPDAWAAFSRNAFTIAAGIAIPVISVLLVIVWIRELRGKETAPGEDPGAVGSEERGGA